MTGSDEDFVIGSEQVRVLAELLALSIPDDESERFAGAVARGLKRYDALDQFAPGEVGPTPAEVTFDPGSEADPHTAFISLFELHDDDADGLLTDWTVAVKDNIAVAGVPLTCGSRVFEAAIPGRHATAVERLLDAGATVVGKTNMDELAYGPTGETSQYGPVTNPAAPGHVAGGSSAGSAAAVAAGRVDAALGSDTGGSVRIPASFCGVVGFKPSRGLVPRTGLVEMATSLDTVGPIAADVETTARLLDAIAGADPSDPVSTSAAIPDSGFARRTTNPPALETFSFGVPAELFGDHVDDTVRAAVEDAIAVIKDMDATVEAVSLPLFDATASLWDVVTNVEFAANLLARFVGVGPRPRIDATWQAAASRALAEGGAFGNVVRREATEGAALLFERDGREYVRAREGCERFRTELASVLADRDALLAPTMPVVAPALGDWPVHEYAERDGRKRTPLSVNVRPANLAGAPALTVPCGNVDGRPVGLQFAGAAGDDATVLAAGCAFERAYADVTD